MKKILLISDSHGDNKLLEKILSDNKGKYDIAIHCGDSLNSDEYMEKYFDYSVIGNNDLNNLPEYLIINIEGYKILICHSHTFLSWKMNFVADLAKAAKDNNCNVVFYGHSHVLSDKTKNNIRIICPGSIYMPRSLSGKTYCIITIDKNNGITNQVNNV